MGKLETRVPPPILLVAIALVMWWVSRYAPHWEVSPAMRFGLAAVILGLGMGINVAGFRAIRRAGSTIDPTRPAAASALVVTGPFRLSRNPMYLGFALLLLAWSAYLQSYWALAGPVAFILYVDRLQIVPEELALRTKFGDDFNRYAAKVRRWL